MITIIDYGLGNILSFYNLYKKINIKLNVARTSSDLEGATKLILPGVGSFDHAMELLNESGMRPEIENLVFQKKIPILGICVGMQFLSNGSEEGSLPGLGWIPGFVKKFAILDHGKKLILPHMGWNDVIPKEDENPLFRNFKGDCRFYFLHSYYFECKDIAHSIANTEYGVNFSSAVNSQNIYGAQFHPEKSHHYGLQLLENFAKL
ncbi:imidazole glycerol phosphate synthase subunit HisH [Leptospira sp. 201903075]|uniref:imidazole glycerol phosphate synthase subunit HisH n=1 Tax=Leptospira chreensis TaxID=2810035 RepID=UPI0019659B68|nr:imidazole glycerol phosphate synthase subunit HisH [Leptospira chreensis]MBM9589042.1 imidazole glycerol phosphate synthase subunit HisH [Leptospira chreensis]